LLKRLGIKVESDDRPVESPPLAAATVVLLRDAPDGMEIFMVERHGLSDVLGGVHVFPGGKVDSADAAADVLQRLDAPLDALHGVLGEPDLETSTAAGVFIAACRETFEEAGILLAEGAGAQHVAEAKKRAGAGVAFGDIIAQLGLRLDWSNVVPWSRWITPLLPREMKKPRDPRFLLDITKRFDARFFLAAVPSDQVARHDDHEATESFWLRPRVVLERYWEARIKLAPVQIMSLVALARHADVADALAAARGRRPPMIQPEPFIYEQQRAIAFPGSEWHPVDERVLAGPSFLVYRNKRFEPVGGFEAFFA